VGDIVGFVHQYKTGGVGAATCGGKGQRTRAIRQFELMFVVGEQGSGLHPLRQPLIHLLEAVEQFHGFIISLGENQNRSDRAEQDQPQRIAQQEPLAFFWLFEFPEPQIFDKATKQLLGLAHEYLGHAIIIVAGVHALVGLYHHFVQHGEAHRLVPIFHHNMLDVVAMVELLPALFDPDAVVY